MKFGILPPSCKNTSLYVQEKSMRQGPTGMTKILDTEEIIGEEEENESFHD